MERNLRLLIAYDGTDFHGWQQQAGVRTVQQELAGILRRIVRHPLELIGASRTDAGVHARGQVASLRTLLPMPVENLRRALADRLPPDLAVLHVAEARPDFHATRSALGKLYRYTLHNSPAGPAGALAARQRWHVWHPLDLERMRAAAAAWLGRHDFAALSNQGSPRESTVRTVQHIGIRRHYEAVYVDIAGDGFLYNQVRIMVGTLYEIGRGHWPVERAAEILATGERARAGATVPARGLCLQWVRYGPGWRAGDGA